MMNKQLNKKKTPIKDFCKASLYVHKHTEQ